MNPSIDKKVGRNIRALRKKARLTQDNIAAQLFAGIYSAVCVTGIRRVIIGGGIERLGSGFLSRLRHLAKRTDANLLMHGITFDYGRITAENSGIGVAEYFIDKKFEIGRKRSV